MATIVVVQSDELAVWTGLIGALGGVVLGAGIDAWRSRRAEHAQTRRGLIRAGNDFAASAESLQVVVESASDAYFKEPDAGPNPLWTAVIRDRMEDARVAIEVIAPYFSPEMVKTLREVGHIAARPIMSGDQAARERRSRELREALAAYRAAVLKSKL